MLGILLYIQIGERMRKETIDKFLEKETKLALEVASKLIEKPKVSIMVVVFPFLLINFIQELRIYRYKREFFLKEYLFLKRLVCDFLNADNLLDDELEKRLENVLVKDEKYKELYCCQIKEGMAIKRYLSGESEEVSIRFKEIETLKKTIEVLDLKGDALETSQRLLNILV